MRTLSALKSFVTARRSRLAYFSRWKKKWP